MSNKSITAPGICAHCGLNPGPSSKNPILWDGFKDIDTGQYCCWKCQPVHYRKKRNGAQATTHSEIPVLLSEVELNTPQQDAGKEKK